MGEGVEVEVGTDGCVDVPIESGFLGQDELKRHHDCVDGGVELYVSPVKKQAKDLPSDKYNCSEVSNPTLCQHVDACGIQGSTSMTTVFPVDGSVVRCSEVTSKCSDLSPKESLSNEESSGSGNSAEFDGRSEGNESGAKC